MPPRRPKKTDDEIDRNLKRAFDDLAAEPLPDRFADLIARLKQGETAKDAADE